MPTPPDFEQACADFRQFRAMLAEALPSITDAPTRQQLESLASGMDQRFAELQQTYPAAQAALDKQLAETKQSIEQTQQTLAGVRAKLAETEQAAAAGPPAPEAPPRIEIEPKLGARLRRELLERFGYRPPPVTPSDYPWEKQREIWEDWDVEDQD